jgi:glycosyltransferase involved in cell wall biosynthesis
MKILQINKFFYKRGGAEAYMLSLSDFLRDQDHQVIEFSMEHPENLKSDYSQYFVKNYELNKRESILKDIIKAGHLIYSFEAKRKLAKLIKKEKPDIVHLHNFYFQLTPSILSVIKKHNIPMVWTMHDYKLICPNYRLFTQDKVCEKCKVFKYYNCLKYKCIKDNRPMSFLAMIESYLHNWLLRSYNKIDLYISPSKFLKSKVTEWGIDKNKVSQIYNFINIENFKPNYESGEGLVYFGRIGMEKGIFVLLEAMKDLPKIPLKIIGDGPLKKDVEDYIKDNNLSNVELIGHTTGNKLFNHIKNARFVVLPSQWYENNPISILEAFALGKPVIGAKIGGIPELVQEGKTGVLFNSGDSQALIRAIKDNYANTDNIAQMGHNCRKFVENNCQPQGHYQQIIEIYQRLVKNT